MGDVDVVEGGILAANGAKLLQNIARGAQFLKLSRHGEKIALGVERGMDGGAEFVGCPAGEKEFQTFLDGIFGRFSQSDRFITIEGGFEVKTDPVDKGQNGFEPFGKSSTGVEADGKA